MKLFLLLTVITIAKSGVIKENSCEGIEVNGVYHDKESLKEGLDRPYMLVVDYRTNTLYFSYTINNDEDTFKTAKIELDNKEFKDIDILNGFAQAVDEENNAVYVGSNDGIYKYEHDTEKIEFVGQRGSDIWSIFYKDALYYSEFPSQFLYTLVNDTAVRFKDLEDTKVDHFLIDDNDTMFYTNVSGLFSQKKGTKDAVFYTDVAIRGMTRDRSDNVFLCVANGVYALNKEETKVNKIADIDNCFGIAFDRRNNLIYADSDSIIRLKSNKNKSC